MTERPILFSGPMVRAILDGRKTQTRRVMGATQDHPVRWPEPGAWNYIRRGKAVAGFRSPADCDPLWGGWALCPYGTPGDRLWVRETFAPVLSEDCGGCIEDSDAPTPCSHTKVEYRADGVEPYWEPETWKPSIFMPRWASRITLEVTGVRVERVQGICRADAVAEGWDPAWRSAEFVEEYRPVLWYSELWDSINGKRPGCAWADNPWVWVVEFKVEGRP